MIKASKNLSIYNNRGNIKSPENSEFYGKMIIAIKTLFRNSKVLICL